MSLRRHYQQAQIVEVLLEQALAEEGKPTVYSEPWINGREKGFCFSKGGSFDTFVYVAECRNSDDLTITTSKFGDWGLVTDEEYRKREFLPYGSYQQACDRVLELLGIQNRVSRRILA